MLKKIIIGVVIVAVIGLIAVIATFKIIERSEKTEELASEVELTMAVEVTKPQIKTISKTQSFLGSVISTHEASVYSKTVGKVVSVPVSIGDKVYNGSTIAVVDIDQPGMKYQYYDAYSPIRGEVASLNVTVGDMVSQEMPIATIVKPDSVKIETHVPANILIKMKPGMEVELTGAYDEFPTIVGKVVSLPSGLNPESHMATIEIKPVDISGGMRSGMFTEVNIPVETRDNALVIPAQALRREAAGDAVYVVEDGKTVRRAVEVGLISKDEMEIVSGILTSDSVIVYGNGRFREGIKIIKMDEFSKTKKSTETKKPKETKKTETDDKS